MHHYIIYYGTEWIFRNSVNVLCKEEDLETIAIAIFHGNVHGNGFCSVEREDGTSITFADCM